MTLPYDLTETRAKQIGLIVLQADETLERDMRMLLAPELECLVSRVPSGTSVTPETLQAMAQDLTQAASLFPQGAQFSAVGYGCTSGTAQIGADTIAALITAGIQTPAVTEPVSALIAACQHLGVSRIGLISPYVARVSDRLRMVLQQAGVTVTKFASFEEPNEDRVVRISASSLENAALELGQNSACDAVFLSCTNLRTLDVIARIEEQINKPVLSSNQVLAWHLCKLAHGAPLGQFGRLFDQPSQDQS